MHDAELRLAEIACEPMGRKATLGGTMLRLKFPFRARPKSPPRDEGVIIEFVFRVGSRHLCVFGAGVPDGFEGITLQSGRAELRPTLLEWHRRVALSPPRQGFVAVFETDAEAAGEFRIGLAGRTQQISDTRLSEDALAFADKAADVSLNHFLMLIAVRHLPPAPAALAAAVLARVRQKERRLLEFPEAAFCLERVRGNPTNGCGIVTGWHLAAPGSAALPMLVAVGASGIVPVTALARALGRQDLAPYRPRYEVSGQDGYCGTFALGGAAKDVVVVGLAAAQGGYRRLFRMAEHADGTSLAIEMVRLRNQLQDESRIARLEAGLALPLPEVSPEVLAGTPPDGAVRTLLLLDHDCDDADIRDVLRVYADMLPPAPTRIQVLRASGSGTLRQAAVGALREGGLDGAEMLEPSYRLPSTEMEGAERLVFARSSALLQCADPAFPVAMLGHDEAAAGALFHRQLARGEATPDLPLLLAGALPMIAAFRVEALRRVQSAIPDSFATLEGQLLAAMAVMGRAGRLRYRVETVPDFLRGRRSGDASERHENTRLFARDLELLGAAMERH
ncbi:hypothetical protein [Algicella marina]|uniref:Uncharacterized protein n=1 Tax=Algicella marina TaxID=2683284 RepID=A0A6P1T239_9RHOB|nr:hypothetical protein [Algicella marina]QHQ36057.1 hypothetical protein GO499_13180 [Algicella marina]